MAVQDNGLGKGPDGSRVDQTSYDARSGAAKHPQRSFETKWGMKDQTGLNGIGPANPGEGPVADGPQPYDPLSSAKSGKTQTTFKASWDMTDANGKGVDHNIGGRVIGEAILSGSANLPGCESYSTDSPVRKP